MANNSFRFVILFLLCVGNLASDEVEFNPFGEEVEINSLANTEGLLSSIVANHVSAISGEYVDNATDFTLEGPEPLHLQRSYSPSPTISKTGFTIPQIDSSVAFIAGPQHLGWQFNHLTTLFFQVDTFHHARHLNLTALVPHAFFSQMLHRGKVKSPHGEYTMDDCSVPLDDQKGVTNCSSGAISGRTNPKNVNVHIKNKHRNCEVHFGSGNRRYYSGYSDIGDRTEEIGVWKYKPTKEVKANGNQILYHKELIESCNSSKSARFSWMKFKRISADEMHVENSHFEPVIYKYKPHKIIQKAKNNFTTPYYLSSVIRPDQPNENYEYTESVRRDGWLLRRKERPNNRFLEVEYYRLGDFPEEPPLFALDFDLDPRVNRVKSLKAPVGADSAPITTHRFFYSLSFDLNKTKKKVKLYRGRTTVYDAYDRKTLYYYNDEQRLEKTVQCIHNIKYLDTHYHWEEGNLKGKVIRNGTGQIMMGRFFDYDDQGNILEEKWYGNLSGTKEIQIEFDKNYLPLNPKVECYKKTFKYSKEGLNLILEEAEPNGRKIQYEYYPHTDLVCSKFLLDRDKICKREFFEYDSNNVLQTHIVDNGITRNKEDLKSVTERHIKRYSLTDSIPLGLPQKIDELVLVDGVEKLVRRVEQSFTKEGRLREQKVFDEWGKESYTLYWDFDKHGNIIKEINALGEITTRLYDENDNLIEERGPSFDFYTHHTYDFSNRRVATEEIHKTGEHFTTLFKYDLVGNKIAMIDRYGNETHYAYDDLNRLITTTYPGIVGKGGMVRPTVKIDYDPLGHKIEEIDAEGYVTKKSYNIRGQVTSILHPNGELEKFEYTLEGTLAKKIASNGTTTHLMTDFLGRVLNEKVYSVKGALMYETSQTFDTFHKTSSTDAMGLTTHFYYHPTGKLKKITCGDKEENYEYDSLGRLTKKREWLGENQFKVNCTEYDLLDRVIEERIEDQSQNILRKISYNYDCLGNRTKIIEENQAGKCETATTYNSDKKPVKSVDAEGNAISISYHYSYCNPYQQLVLQTTATDPLGRQTIITYDAMERPVNIKRKDPFGILLAYQEMFYDLKGNLIKTIDHVIAEGKEIRSLETAFEYESKGQLTRLIQAKGLPEQQITTMTYNKYGQKEKVTKGNGTLLHYLYDSLGRLDSYTSSDQSVSYKYLYNERNQPVEIRDLIHNATSLLTYDKLGRLSKEILSTGIALHYEYDLLDRVTAVTLPDSSSIAYHYDQANLKKVERIKSGNVIYSHSYDVYDLSGLCLKCTSMIGQDIDYTFDLLKRPLSLKAPLSNIQGIKYDTVGRLTEYALDEITYQYQYDDNDHLVWEKGNEEHHYTSDSLHNRLCKDQSKYLSNGLHQLIHNGESTFTYDQSGNLSCIEGKEKISYTYDALDRLIKIEGKETTHYLYDSFHRRVAKIEGKEKTRYLYAGQDEIGSMDRYDQIKELRILGQGVGAEIGASIAIELQGKIYAPHHDLRGNIISLTDLQGNLVESYRYTAFGETSIYDSYGHKAIQSSVGNPWRYSSKRTDEESGFIDFGRRYYDPSNGRWITADPNGLSDGPNLYAFLHHRPTQGFDLYGLQDTALQEPYYPYQNFDFQDKGGDAQNPTDATPNVVPEGFEEKKIGKKSRMFFCGFHEIANVSITFMNGIMNNLKDAWSSAANLSKMANDHFVTFCYNKSRGFIGSDLVRSALELYFYMDTAAVKLQRQMWDGHFAKLGPEGMIFHECHSEGAIITRNALMGYPEELRKRIVVAAFAPGAYISKQLAYQVTHYRSTRDIVPLLDFVGAYKCRDTTVVLTPHPDAPLFDHSLASPTYSEHMQREVNQFISEFGGR